MHSRLLASSLAFLFLTGFGSCGTTLKEACQGRIPKLIDRVSTAAVALRPWQEEEDRSPASANYVPLAKQDRESWEQWAVEMLKETQTYIDLTQSEPWAVDARGALTETANALVALHGYAVQGNVGRMIVVLLAIQESSQKARDLACAHP